MHQEAADMQDAEDTMDDANQAGELDSPLDSVETERTSSSELYCSDDVVRSIFEMQTKHGETEEFGMASLRICEKVLGPNSHQYAAILQNLAILHQEQGNYKEAEELCTESLYILEQEFGPNSHSCATTLRTLANLHQEQGNFKESEEHYMTSLRIDEKLFGPNSHQCATILHHLANLYTDQGKYKEAEEHYTTSLRIREQEFGPNSRQYATVLHNLAALHQEQGNYKEAEEHYTASLCIEKQLFGPNSHQYAVTLQNLAILHKEQGNYKEAEEHFTTSLGIHEQLFGPNSRQYAVTLQNLANLYTDQGKYKQAEEHYTTSLRIRWQVFGPNSHQYATTLQNLAVLNLRMRRHEQSRLYFQQASSIMLRVFGERSLYMAKSFCTNARIHYEQGCFHAAVELLQQGLGVYEQLTGRDSYKYLSTLSELGEMFFGHGQHEEAKRSLHQALTLPGSKDLPSLKARMLSSLGDLYSELEQYEQAEEHYQKALACHKPFIHTPDTMRRYVTILLSLGFLHQQQDNQQQARRYFRKAMVLRTDKKAAFAPSLHVHHLDYDPLDDVENALEDTRLGFGPRSMQYAQALRNLAGVLSRQEQLDLSRVHDLYQEALLIYKENRDYSQDRELLIAATHHSLGRLHLDRSAEEFHIALEIYESLFGPEGRQVGMTLFHLAEYYLDCHDEGDDDDDDDEGEHPSLLDLAFSNLEKALHIYTLVFGPNSRQCADIHATLGRAYAEQAQQQEMDDTPEEELNETWAKSDEAYLRALRIFKVAMGMDSRQFVETIAARARMFQRRGQPERAGRLQSSASTMENYLS